MEQEWRRNATCNILKCTWKFRVMGQRHSSGTSHCVVEGVISMGRCGRAPSPSLGLTADCMLGIKRFPGLIPDFTCWQIGPSAGVRGAGHPERGVGHAVVDGLSFGLIDPFDHITSCSTFLLAMRRTHQLLKHNLDVSKTTSSNETFGSAFPPSPSRVLALSPPTWNNRIQGKSRTNAILCPAHMAWTAKSLDGF